MMKRMLLRVGPLLVLLHSSTLIAGTVDSLQAILATAGPDTHRVGLLCKLAYEIRRTDPEMALTHLDEGHALAEKLNYAQGANRANLYYGMIYTARGAFDQAESALKQALKGYQRAKDANGIGKGWNKLGILYFYQGDYEKAVSHYESALENFTDGRAIAMTYNNMALAFKATGKADRYLECTLYARKAFEKLGDLKSVAMVLGNLGTFYLSMGEPDKAITYFRESAAVLPEGGDLETQASNTLNLGQAHAEAGNEEEAVVAYRKSVALAREGGLVIEEGVALNNLANFYEEKGEFGKARERYQEALALFEQAGNAKYQAAVVNNLSEMQLSQGDTSSALDYLHRALSLALESGDLQRIGQIYKNLGGLYESVGRAKEALRYEKLYGQMRDSLLDETKLKEIIALEVEYETELREEKLEVVAQENAEIAEENLWLWLAVGGMSLLLMVGSFLLWRQRQTVAVLRQDHFDVAVAYAEVKGRLAELAARPKAAGQAASPQEQAGPGLPPQFEQLSKREIEVFLCLANGLANKAVAEELHISVDTVRSHVKNIYSKLEVRNRGMVISMAHEYGIVNQKG